MHKHNSVHEDRARRAHRRQHHLGLGHRRRNRLLREHVLTSNCGGGNLPSGSGNIGGNSGDGGGSKEEEGAAE